MPKQEIQKHYTESVYNHLDPISVSLQERVKYGGHVTSVLDDRQLGPFEEQNFQLQEVGRPV